MKYKDVDWSIWNQKPDQEAYEAWVVVRDKKKSATTQYALKLAGKHINHLIDMGYSATEVLDIAIEKSWAGLEWVVKDEAKKGFKQNQYVGNVKQIRTTREIPLQEELTDRSWADEN